MNKVLFAALAAGMIFSLAACNNQSNNGANSGNKEDYMILKTEYNGANVDTVAEQYSAIRKILIKGMVNDEVK